MEPSMTTGDSFTIGVDFGTSSVRSLILNDVNGEEAAAANARFPRWEQGMYCDPSRNIYRQHPSELLDAFTESVSGAVAKLSRSQRKKVRGITIDTTGSSPLPVDKAGTPLAFRPEFASDPDALCILWKDRSSSDAAGLITEYFHSMKNHEKNFLAYSGDAYSPEWFWAKILHISGQSPAVAEAAETWVEHCDWLTAEITGVSQARQIIRSRCGAAHKALWHSRFNGFPHEEVFAGIHPYLGRVRKTMGNDTLTSDRRAGFLTEDWRRKLGLSSAIVVGVGLFDAHAGAVGAGIQPGIVVKTIGTSSADMVVAEQNTPYTNPIPGVESQAEGSMIPEMVGIEAGQPAFGDLFEWFATLMSFPSSPQTGREQQQDTLSKLESAAARRVGETRHFPIAVDWFNGRRAPYANAKAEGTISGLSLVTDAVDMYISLVRSVACGTKAIHDLLRKHNIDIRSVHAVGGIPQKSPFVMQELSNVLQTPVEVARTLQASARGAAIMASVAAGRYKDAQSAIAQLGSGILAIYTPEDSRRREYAEYYQRYMHLAGTLDRTFRI